MHLRVSTPIDETPRVLQVRGLFDLAAERTSRVELIAPEMQGVFATLLQILTPYPEARAAVAQALADNRPRVIEARASDEAAP